MNDAFFPERLRVNPGDADELEFRTRNISRDFGSKIRHHIVVVDEEDKVLGYAEWTNGNDPVVDMTPEERDKKREEWIKRLPKSFDLQAAERVMKEVEPLSKMLKVTLGQKGYENSWSRSSSSTCYYAASGRDNANQGRSECHCRRSGPSTQGHWQDVDSMGSGEGQEWEQKHSLPIESCGGKVVPRDGL